MNYNLREICSTDYNLVLALWQNELVRKFLGGITTVERANSYFFEIIKQNQESMHYIVQDKISNIGIGLISIDNYYELNKKEISYQFLPEYWGKGIASHFVREMLFLGKKKMNIFEIFAETQNKNIKSKKLLENIGMKEIRKIERYGEIQTVFWKSL